MTTRKELKITFKERERTLRFGIGPSRILCERREITLSQFNELDPIEAVYDMVWASLVFDCYQKDEEPDFNYYQVMQWISDMQQEEFQEVFDLWLHTKVIGRSLYDEYQDKLDKLREENGTTTKKKSSAGKT